MNEIEEFRNKVLDYIISDEELNEFFKDNLEISDYEIKNALKYNLSVEKFIAELIF